MIILIVLNEVLVLTRTDTELVSPTPAITSGHHQNVILLEDAHNVLNTVFAVMHFRPLLASCIG